MKKVQRRALSVIVIIVCLMCGVGFFTFRFFIEFCKEVQVDFEQGMTFDMGQLLSIPFVIGGIWLMLHSRKK